MKNLVCLFLFLAFSIPAYAGVLNMNNGAGAWQSTVCQRPLPFTVIGMNSETAAPAMNNAMQRFNGFVQQTQNYLDCLAREARQDSENANSLITGSLEKEMQDAQNEVNRARAQIFGK